MIEDAYNNFIKAQYKSIKNHSNMEMILRTFINAFSVVIWISDIQMRCCKRSFTLAVN